MNKIYLYIIILMIVNACSPTKLVDKTVNSFAAVATQGDYEDKILVSWTDLDAYKNYVILRSEGINLVYKEVSSFIKGASYEDHSIKKGQIYYYKVRAYNDVGMPIFITKSTVGFAGVGGGFHPPSNIKIYSGKSTKELQLEWDRTKDAVTYEIWRSIDNDYFQPIAKAPYLHYYDKDVLQGVVYYYQISSINKNNDPSPNRSQTISGMIFGGDIKLYSRAGAFDDKIELHWTKVLYTKEYQIYRSENPDSTGTKIATITKDQNSYSYIDKTAEFSKLYYYTIIYKNDSAIQKSQTIRSYLKVESSPQKPQNFKVSQGEDPKFVKLSWDEIIDNKILEYEIFRSSSRTGPWINIYTGGNNEYKDIPLDKSYTYFYKVVALNPAPGEESDIKEGWANRPPVNIIASTTYGKKVILKWDEVPKSTQYNIYYSLKKDGDYKLAGSVNRNSVRKITYNHIYDIGDLKSKELFYKLEVVTPNGTSDQSKVIKGIIKKIAAPENLKILNNKAATQIVTLRWDNVPNARKYVIYRATLKHMGVLDSVQLKNHMFKEIAEVQNNAYQATLTSFPLRRYIYQIKAIDGGDAAGLAKTSETVWRVPVSVEEFLKDVDFSIIHAQKQVNNFGYNGSSGTVQGRHKGSYEYKAGISGSKSSWFGYVGFEVQLEGQPSLQISLSPMGAKMDGDVHISGLYSGKVTYNNLLGLDGGYTGGGSITAHYNHPSKGTQTKTWTYTEAGAILQSVILKSESKPSTPQFEEGYE